MIIVRFFLCCFVIFTFNSYEDNSTDSPIDYSKSNNELVKVRLDMHYGFADKIVSIINDVWFI